MVLKKVHIKEIHSRAISEESTLWKNSINENFKIFDFCEERLCMILKIRHAINPEYS